MKQNSKQHATPVVGSIVLNRGDVMNPKQYGDVIESKTNEWGTDYVVRMREEVCDFTGEVCIESTIEYVNARGFQDGNGFARWVVIK